MFRSDHPLAQFVSPHESGKWGVDNKTGNANADALLDYIAETECPISLGHVVNAMMQAGRYGGVEVGFFHRIAERAMF